MTRLLLNGSWELSNGRTGDRYTATVPGFVQKDLMQQGALPNEYDTLFEPKIEWVEYDEWTYTRSFALGEHELSRDALELVLEGVDTYAEVSLNGKVLGTTENMFVAYRFDIKGIAQADNELSVRIASPTNTLKEKEAAFGATLNLWNGIPARLFGRKAQYGYGWDWGARVVTVGIHKPVSVAAYDVVRADALGYAITHLSDAKAIVNAAFTVAAAGADPVEATVRYALYDGETIVAERTERAMLTPGAGKFEAALEIARPKRWYPLGHGEQALYRLEASVLDEGGEAVAAMSRAVGLREVRIDMPYDEQGRKFIIQVNGIPVLCKGVNWIPLKLFPNLDTKEEYEVEIERIAAANMNMIRVWGGGTYENHDFFDACDRLGVMVWQDFMFACGDYPDDDAFSALVRQEADYVISEFGSHPSIVLWCGNNENQVFVERSRVHRKHGYGEKLYFEVLHDACAADTLRPYWPSSPYSLTFDHTKLEGNYGDLHSWFVWGQTHPYEEYRDVNGRFLSEFGMQSYPSTYVLNRVDPAATLRDPKLDAMQKAPNGIQRLFYYTVGDYKLPAAKDEFVYVNQLMQANALRYGVEHWVSRMPDTSGALIWQWSDLWPSISWALVDYGKVHKPSYFYMKRSFQSPNAYAKITPGTDEAELYLIHDHGSLEGRIVVELYDLTTDSVVQSVVNEVQGVGHRSTRIGTFSTAGFDAAKTIVCVSLYEGEALRSASTYLLGKPHQLALKPARITLEQETLANGDTRFTLSSDVFAKDVGLVDMPGTLSDNYFDLRAGERREIVLKGGLPAGMTATAICLNQVKTLDYV
ncbi:beta-mannosidase [Cohnella sp. 56]|uniref:beta-mannosidase n=1 Tax=Cohnella sp. 56 TaxID=3113722 RepID=UPI0030EA3287